MRETVIPWNQLAEAGWPLGAKNARNMMKGEPGPLFLQVIDYADVPSVAEDLSRSKTDRNRRLNNEKLALDRGAARWLGATVDDARRMAERGWPEGMAKIANLRDQISAQLAPPVSVRRRPVWRAEGDDLDYDRLRSGRLDEMWRTCARAAGRGPRTVSIYAEIGGNCNLRPEQMFYSGACALATAEILENAGYRVEVFASQFTHGHSGENTWQGSIIQLKAASEPMRPDVLAFALSHSVFFRHYVLLMFGQMPGQLLSNYGYPADAEKRLRVLGEIGEIPKPDIVFGWYENERGCVEAIKRELARVTGEPAVAA